MDQRIDVTDEQIMESLRRISEGLQTRLRKKGRKSFIGLHEIDGILDEEVREFKAEVHNDDCKAAVDELVDVAVTSLFGVASLGAIARADAAEAAKPAPQGTTP